MPVDVRDFVIPESDFSGLNKLSDNLERQRYIKKAEDEKDAARKGALSVYLNNILDPKDYLTDTVHDAAITSGLSKIMDEGVKLASQKGMDNNMLYMGLSPMIKKLSMASHNIKEIERRGKEFLPLIKARKGVDAGRFIENYRKNAYYNPDGTVKDFSQVDPSQNYLDKTLRSDIYTNEAFDDFVKNSAKNPVNHTTEITDANGRKRKAVFEVSSPYYFKPEKFQDGSLRFVPLYDEAGDDGSGLIHHFKGENVKAPVRMLKDEVYKSLPPEAISFLDQEAQKFAQAEKIDINDPRVEMFKRAIAYDELKRSERQGNSYKEIQEKKEAPIRITNTTRVYNNSGVGKKDDTENYGNEFDNIGDHQYPGGTKISGGMVYNSDGTPKTGYIDVPVSAIPATLEASLKSLDKENAMSIDNGFVTFYVKDGKFESLKTVTGTQFRRNANIVGQQNIGRGSKFEGKKPFGERGVSNAPSKQSSETKPKSGVNWKKPNG